MATPDDNPTIIPPAVAVVVSRYNAEITDALADGAARAYADRGGSPDTLAIIDAPGAFELTTLAMAAAETGAFRGIVALGCIIKGETDHDTHIASAVAHGVTDVATTTGVPVAFGVLTVNTMDQARARAGGELGNKGDDAMHALLDTIEQADALTRAAETGDFASITRLGRDINDKAKSAR